jgi:hypothetical protein
VLLLARERYKYDADARVEWSRQCIPSVHYHYTLPPLLATRTCPPLMAFGGVWCGLRSGRPARRGGEWAMAGGG